MKYLLVAVFVLLFVCTTHALGASYFNTPVQRNLKAARMMQRRVDIDCNTKCKENDGGLELTRCVQKCASLFCYSAIIDQELEEGEIDTRDTRFKTCLIEDIKRRKRTSQQTTETEEN